ncbi:hypothetical protein S101413_03518 [Bacillus velezensis]|nr:hypothetical protein S101413_03518 [Bacillus velezensis]
MMDWFTSVKTIYGWGRSITVMQTWPVLLSGEELQKININK